MDEIEQRLSTALNARADLVVAESLGEAEDLPPARDRRRLVLVAAAATVIAVAGTIAVSSWDYRGAGETATPLTTVSSPPSSSVEPTKEPTATNPSATSPSTTSTTATGKSDPPPPPPKCGGKTCKLVQTVQAGGDTLELWAGRDKVYDQDTDWQVRVRGVPLTGGKLTSSFVGAESVRCSTVSGRPMCLISTWYLGDSDASVGLAKEGGTWRFTGATFLTPYGAERIEITDLYSNGSIEVVSVESRFPDEKPQYTAQVWRWNGSRLGCTPRVDAPEKLPGWPTVTPDVATLAIANCF